jgi:hypothetical protein
MSRWVRIVIFSVLADVGDTPKIDRNSDLPVGRKVPITTKSAVR